MHALVQEVYEGKPDRFYGVWPAGNDGIIELKYPQTGIGRPVRFGMEKGPPVEHGREVAAAKGDGDIARKRGDRSEGAQGDTAVKGPGAADVGDKRDRPDAP